MRFLPLALVLLFCGLSIPVTNGRSVDRIHKRRSLGNSEPIEIKNALDGQVDDAGQQQQQQSSTPTGATITNENCTSDKIRSSESGQMRSNCVNCPAKCQPAAALTSTTTPSSPSEAVPESEILDGQKIPGSEVNRVSEPVQSSQSKLTSNSATTGNTISKVEPTGFVQAEKKFTTTTTTTKPKVVSKVTLYLQNDLFGELETYELVKGQCMTLPNTWRRRVNSVNTHETCVQLCELRYCQGFCIDVKPGSPSHNRLRELEFEGRTSSVRPCPPDESTNKI